MHRTCWNDALDSLIYQGDRTMEWNAENEIHPYLSASRKDDLIVIFSDELTSAKNGNLFNKCSEENVRLPNILHLKSSS